MPNQTLELDTQLAAQVRELACHLDRAAHLYAEAKGLYGNDFRALCMMDAAERSGLQLTAGELAQQLSLSSGAVTYLVERLVASGHVERQSDPNDRRKVLLVRSAQGREVSQGYVSPLDSLSQVALAEFEADELTTVSRVIARLERACELYREELAHSSAGRTQPAGRRKAG